MENEIVNGIGYLRSGKKRPGMEEIFYYIKRKDESVTMELFKEAFDKLLENGTISKPR